jgi:hypothetical protein
LKSKLRIEGLFILKDAPRGPASAIRKFFFTPKDDTGRLLSQSHLGEGDRIELDASEN